MRFASEEKELYLKCLKKKKNHFSNSTDIIALYRNTGQQMSRLLNTVPWKRRVMPTSPYPTHRAGATVSDSLKPVVKGLKWNL